METKWHSIFRWLLRWNPRCPGFKTKINQSPSCVAEHGQPRNFGTWKPFFNSVSPNELFQASRSHYLFLFMINYTFHWAFTVRGKTHAERGRPEKLNQRLLTNERTCGDSFIQRGLELVGIFGFRVSLGNIFNINKLFQQRECCPANSMRKLHMKLAIEVLIVMFKNIKTKKMNLY